MSEKGVMYYAGRDFDEKGAARTVVGRMTPEKELIQASDVSTLDGSERADHQARAPRADDARKT